MRGIFFSVLCLFLPVVLFAASALNFDNSGQVTSLVLNDVNYLKSDVWSGFELVSKEGKRVRLSEVARSGDKIKVSYTGGEPSFVFQIEAFDHHVAIHLLEAKGIGSGHDYTLSLALETEAVAAYTLNDMMTISSGKRHKKKLELKWPYLWGHARPNGTHGSVVLYDQSLTGSELDAVLAEIWSVQGNAGQMVRPAGQASWSPEDVLDWVKRWSDKFESLVCVSIAPENEEELYAMTERLVIPTKANRVYMFSTVWRGEYTLRKLANESVAGSAFPAGKADLLRYSDYLAQHGAHLQLKSLVPQLGHDDERYFSEDFCEPRLLSWGAGTLVEKIDAKDQTLRFKPGPGYVWEQEFGYLRIDNELIFAEAITIDDDGIWTLENCERGKFATVAKRHKAGSEVVGVSHSYGFVHFDDDFGQPNSLAEEVLGAYGDFLNEVNAGHLHFDGTGKYPECPWYLRDYTDYVYSRMEHPVTGSRVGGSIPANFEKMFSLARRATQASGYWGIRIGPRLHGQGRGSEKEQRNFSPNMLDIHFDVSDRILLGARRPNFTAGRSGGTLDMNIIENYGLLDESLELFKDWIKLAPVYDTADVAYVKRHLQKKKGSNHYEGEDVLVLSQDSQGRYIYTPHRIMGRTSGEDPLIFIDQEWGAIPRRQQIQADTTMELLNPYDAQEPRVVIYVEENSTPWQDPLISVNGSGQLAVAGEVAANEYMCFDGGDSVMVYDSNWNELRKLPASAADFVVKQGANSITTSSATGHKAEEVALKVQYITVGPEYVLESNQHL
jgi:hypothetical protein